MSRKKNRKQQRNRAASEARAGSPRKWKFRLNPVSLVFIGLLVFAVVVVAVASVLGDRPECPPGQVWSSAHNHCH
jgi:hypothetical protein